MNRRVRALAPRGLPGAPRPADRTSPAGLVAGVTAVAAALRSGADPAVAWHRGLGVRTHAGIPLAADLRQRSGGDLAAAAAVVAAARLAETTGAPLASVLDRIAATLVQDAEAAGQRRAALAGPRATARLLAWLPALGVVGGFALGADPVAVLLDGGAGSVLLLTGGALTMLGRRWGGYHLRAAAARAD